MEATRQTRLNTLDLFIEDAYHYLRAADKRNDSAEIILSTLVHDICGLRDARPCFCPRVSGSAANSPTRATERVE